MEPLWILEIRLCSFIEVETDGGFIRSETFFFHSLRSFREVVVNGGFNFEWNAIEFLKLDYVRL